MGGLGGQAWILAPNSRRGAPTVHFPCVQLLVSVALPLPLLVLLLSIRHLLLTMRSYDVVVLPLMIGWLQIATVVRGTLVCFASWVFHTRR